MKLRLIFVLLISFVFASSCSTYNEMFQTGQKFVLNPTKGWSWYKPCNFKSPEFKKFLDIVKL